MRGGRIPRSFIEQLLHRVDIVQVIGQRVPLKKAGRNYVACCPFHDEKTPSFNVNPVRQFYHCFGCGASGDAIRFLQDYEGLSFQEAVEALAQQHGLEVPRERLTPEKQKQLEKQATLYDVLMQAARFYRHQLRDHPEAARARAYLRQRGLTPEIAKRYYIGFAPPEWDALQQAFADQWQQVHPLLLESGLRIARESGSGSYDRFRNRIIFPIRDRRGRVLGFGGRVLGDEKPKYLNSPESPVFHKGQILYGLYEWQQQRRRDTFLIVVEGYMDVIALAQHGLPNTVATLGTALTEDHAHLLYQQVSEVVFSFDGDAAGRKAAWKAVEILLPRLTEQQQARFLFLPTGEDPDSFIRKQGLEAFQHQLKTAPDMARFIVQETVRAATVPLSEQEGRRQFLAGITPWLKRAQGWHQAALLEQAAGLLDLRPWQLARQLQLHVPLASNRPPLKMPRFHMPPVIGLPHRILHGLLRCPALTAELFSPADAQQLGQLSAPGADLLGWCVARLLEGQPPETLRSALNEQGHQKLLQEMDMMPTESCEAVRRSLASLLKQLLAQSQLAQTDDIAEILALKRAQNTP